MAKCIVFHSYKGGTGKTTIAANLAALIASKGYRVLLLDLDVYAPSMHSYFEIEPKKWINDFLQSQAEVEEVMVDLSSLIAERAGQKEGRLWVGFSNPSKDEIYKLEGGKEEKVHLLRRFIAFREKLFATFDIDYLIIDTSPGIRYWSLNALAVADVLYLTLKAGDLDVAGTKRMASDIYSTFSKFGAKPFLLLNRVEGYCVPRTLLVPRAIRQDLVMAGAGSTSAQGDDSRFEGIPDNNPSATDVEETSQLSKDIGMQVISALPCYCDIQFSKKEFLTSLSQPDHPFSRKVFELSEKSSK